MDQSHVPAAPEATDQSSESARSVEQTERHVQQTYQRNKDYMATVDPAQGEREARIPQSVLDPSVDLLRYSHGVNIQRLRLALVPCPFYG